MDMEQLYNYVPRELVTFILVTLFSLLIGLSQRRISLKREGETTLFGTDRCSAGFTAGVELLCKAIPIPCLWCYHYYYCLDYLLYGSYRSHPAFLVLRYGNSNSASID